MNAHWAPQSSLLLIPKEEFNFIGKVEKINDGLKKVLLQIFKKDVKIKNYFLHSTNASKKLQQYYNKENRDLIINLYRNDFETFKYSLELPLE